MASTRPPGTYSPSARTGRRGGGSGSVAGMVRRAGPSDGLRRGGSGFRAAVTVPTVGAARESTTP